MVSDTLSHAKARTDCMEFRQEDQGMSTSGVIQPNQGSAGAGITAEIAEHRAKTVVLHNSRILCWAVMGLGVCSLFIGICMMLMVISVLTPWSNIGFMRVMAGAQWGLGGFLFAYMCPSLWKWGLAMAHKRVTMDERGVDLRLGTKKKPVELFMAWDTISAVKQQRVGNAQQFTIQGSDQSYAQFSSYTFFRPKRVARMIAERVGLTIQKV
jgi:hypothetical protein